MLPASPLLLAQLLCLLLLANGLPILMRYLLGSVGAVAVDGGRHCADGTRWLGASKTWRGLLAAILGTGLTAGLMGLPVAVGFDLGLWAMLGDLSSSFIKRRLHLASGARATGLDQLPEAVLPLLAVRDELGVSMPMVGLLALLFLLLDIALSRWLYSWHIRERPY